MDPIERVSDAVAALVGRDLTLEDAHQFLLDAAKLWHPLVPSSSAEAHAAARCAGASASAPW